MSTPKEFLSSLIRPVADFELDLKRPLIEAGLPDVPLPAQFCVALLDALPEPFPPPIAPPVESETSKTSRTPIAQPIHRSY